MVVEVKASIHNFLTTAIWITDCASTLRLRVRECIMIKRVTELQTHVCMWVTSLQAAEPELWDVPG